MGFFSPLKHMCFCASKTRIMVYKQPSQLRRTVLLFHYNNGIRSVQYLCKLTGLSRASVFRNIKKINTGIGIQRKKQEKKKPLTPNQQRCLVRLALCHPKWSAQQLANELATRGQVAISRSTVLRILNNAGIFKFKAVKVPPLTSLQKVNRIKWCKENLNTDWSRVIFSDESYFQAYSNILLLWAKSRPQIPMPKFPPKILIWGAICQRGLLPIHIARGHIDSDSYQQILLNCLLKHADKLYPDGYIFQQDNATPHTSKSTRSFFEEHSVPVLSWPANSPDLNPIENLWAVMKRAVDKFDPTNTITIEKAVKKVSMNISPEVLESLVNSMPNRLQLCIQAKGEKIKY